MPTKVKIIIPVYNGTRWLVRCLESVLAAGGEFSVEVVDNASSDGSAELVQERFPGVSLVRVAQNVGFARAANLGLHRALAEEVDWVVLLNQDTWVRPDWLTELLRGAIRAQLGIASPMQYDYEGRKLETHFARLLKWHGHDAGSAAADDRPVLLTEWVIGAAMVLRADVLRTVGNFDPNYFFYGEEIDLCRRALMHGFRIGVVTGSVVAHNEQTPEEASRPARIYHRLLGDYVYQLKSPDRPLPWLLARCGRNAVRDFCLGVIRHRPDYLKELVKVQWALLRKLPAIVRRRRQERQCPQHLW